MNLLYMLAGKAESSARPLVEVMRDYIAAGSPEADDPHPFWAGVIEAPWSVERQRAIAFVDALRHDDAVEELKSQS